MQRVSHAGIAPVVSLSRKSTTLNSLADWRAEIMQGKYLGDKRSQIPYTITLLQLCVSAYMYICYLYM